MEFLLFLAHWLNLFSRFAAAAFLTFYQVFTAELVSRSIKKAVLIFAAAGVLTEPLFLSWTQWQLWRDGNISQYLLPPHTSPLYFLGYTWTHFWISPAFTFMGAILLFGFLNLLSELRPFWFFDDEPFFAAMSFLSSGWPGGLLMVALVLLAGLLAHLLSRFLLFPALSLSLNRSETIHETEAKHQGVSFPFRVFQSLASVSRHRLALRPFWLPVALLIFLFGDILIKWAHLTVLRP